MLELEQIYRVELFDEAVDGTTLAGGIPAFERDDAAPPPGQIAIFDRTWYGRVLVERVEGLSRPKEWRRAYDEINGFEKMLVDEGVRLIKLFLHTSDAEQLRRFQERIATPTKRWKMSAEDIRNRAHRRDYLVALDEMFARTSTAAAPWHVVPAEYNGSPVSPWRRRWSKRSPKGWYSGPLPSPRKLSSGRRNHGSQGNGGTRPGRARAGERLIAQSTPQLWDDPERLLAAADALDVVARHWTDSLSRRAHLQGQAPIIRSGCH